MSRPNYPIRRYAEVLGYNAKKRFRSDYLGYGKVGYFDEAFEELSIDEICKKIGVNRRDIDEIEQMTKYKVEGAVYYLNANRRIVRVGERSRVSAFDYELKAMTKVIHSHPSGASFSPKDVELALGYGIKQSVVFNDVYVYNLTIDEDLHIDRRLIKNKANEIYNRLANLVMQGKISESQLMFSINHKIWKAVAAVTKGFRYEYYKIKK